MRLRTLAANIAVGLLATVLTVLVVERLLPWVVRKEIPSRALYFSEIPWFKADVGGDYYVRMAKGRTMRSYAQYDKTVDFDVSITTDENGFRNSRARPTDRPTVAVVGDSYTEGMGGPSWVERLNDRTALQKGFFYNAGIAATGTRHWPALVADFSARLGVNRFVIVYIAEDLGRPHWYPHPIGGEVEMCTSRCAHTEIYYDETLMKKNLAAGPERFGTEPAKPTLFNRWLPNIAGLIRKARARFSRPKDNRLLHLDAFVAKLTAMPDNKYLLIQIPSKDGYRSGAKAYVPTAVSERVRYESGLGCFKEIGDFHHFDVHPNEQGYRRLAECIGGIIERQRDFILQ